MTTTVTPYETFNAGELIEAERMNNMQIKIRSDISDQVNGVAQALQTHLDEPVDADTFGGKTPDEWTSDFDERYVVKSEIGAGWGEYRRYFKQLDQELGGAGSGFGPVIIEHNLQRFPLATVFTLEDLGGARGDGESGTKFMVYYAGHRDDVSTTFLTRGLDSVHWGDPLSLILDQFGLQVTPKQLFDDVLNDLWEHMFDPGLDQDHFNSDKYGHSDYIQKQVLDKDRTVDDLKQSGIWDDLHMAIRPRMIPVGIENLVQGEVRPLVVELFHLSQNALEIRANQTIDLMVLLRT